MSTSVKINGLLKNNYIYYVYYISQRIWIQTNIIVKLIFTFLIPSFKFENK